MEVFILMQRNHSKFILISFDSGNNKHKAVKIHSQLGQSKHKEWYAEEVVGTLNSIYPNLYPILDELK